MPSVHPPPRPSLRLSETPRQADGEDIARILSRISAVSLCHNPPCCVFAEHPVLFPALTRAPPPPSHPPRIPPTPSAHSHADAEREVRPVGFKEQGVRPHAEPALGQAARR